MVPVSSLSVAIQGIANFLNEALGSEVSVSVRNPASAKETADTSNDAHILNFFVYRITPSGFHAAQTPNEPLFVRLHALLTPFLGTQTEQASDADLRILGHVLRIFSENPVIPVPDDDEPEIVTLPGNPANGGDDDFRSQEGITHYRVDAVLQTPSMEELNHIWTTQGGDLAYRLSLAYEFSLIPIEPLNLATPSASARTAILDLAPNTHEIENGFTLYSENAQPIPLAGSTTDSAPPTNWLPVILVAEGDALSTQREIASDATSVDVALAGLPDARVALEITWTRSAGGIDTQTELLNIAAARIDDPAARVTIELGTIASGDAAILQASIVDELDQPLAGSPAANSVALTVM